MPPPDETPAGSEVVQLQYPIEYSGETLERVTLRRPTGKEMRRLPSDTTPGDLMVMAAACSGLSDVAFDRMDALDITRILDVVAAFLGAGQGTGAKR